METEIIMQTFLVYPDFKEALRCLDPSRLGNQVYREGLTLLRGGWSNHPASKMWQGYLPALAQYIWDGLDVLAEREKYYDHHRIEVAKYMIDPVIMPPWLGNEVLHASHRSNLLRKDSEYYGQFGWTESNDMPYVWPV
jgi:hypothetical protein